MQRKIVFKFLKEVNLVKNDLSKVNNVPSDKIFPSVFFNLNYFHNEKKNLRNLAKKDHTLLDIAFKYKRNSKRQNKAKKIKVKNCSHVYF